ncbi:MAG: sugar-binding domain-containing protein [Stappiaceae bacterium]
MKRKGDEDWNIYLATRAAWLSFIGGRTQGEIADRLGISPAKVHRLIALAQKNGLVKFQIEGRPLECLKFEDEISAAFGLNNCLITPDLGGGEEASIMSVAAAAGPLLSDMLGSPTVKQVGVGMGRTLKASVEAMPRLAQSDLDIVSVSGSLTRKLSANPYDVVQKMIERTGGEGYYLPVPYIADSRAEKDMFLNQSSVLDLLNRARKSDLFVIGIGSTELDGHLVAREIITCEEHDKLSKDGVVCDLMGRFLDSDGKLVPIELGEQAVGLHYEDVRGARVIALAGGAGKTKATLAALKSGVITDLVADESLARNLVTKIDRKSADPTMHLVQDTAKGEVF